MQTVLLLAAPSNADMAMVVGGPRQPACTCLYLRTCGPGGCEGVAMRPPPTFSSRCHRLSDAHAARARSAALPLLHLLRQGFWPWSP